MDFVANLRGHIARRSRSNFGGGVGVMALRSDGRPARSDQTNSRRGQTNSKQIRKCINYRIFVSCDKLYSLFVIVKPVSLAAPQMALPLFPFGNLTEVEMAKRKSKIIRKPVAPPINEWPEQNSQ